MAALTTGKIVEIVFENAIETFMQEPQMIDLTSFSQPDGATMQNAGNVIWKTMQQHRPIIQGFDLTGQEQGIIQETCPYILGTPNNDIISQRIDDMRDMAFWEQAGKESGKRQAYELNKDIASKVALQGSMFIRTNTTSGYNAVSGAQTLINERQLSRGMGAYFVLNDRDNNLYSQDLAGRQTLQGRPADTWKTGQIGANVAEFDLYVGSYLPNLVGGADPATTVTGNQSFAPEGGTVNTSTGVVTNVDYRIAAIPVADSAAYNVGDKVQFANGGTAVRAVGLADKTDTGQPMTFTIVGKPDGTTIQVYPKPIALDDPGLTALQAAYANINTRILNAATVNRVNIDATNKTNLFWTKPAVAVTGGTIPAQLFKQFNGMQVVQKTMSNGLTMYMLYSANTTTLQMQWRLFVWYGVTIPIPAACGVLVTY